MKHFRIDEYFILGGFGELSVTRSDLIKYAIKKAEKLFGKIEKSKVFIIGDKIHDIKAAKDSGATIIAIATGTTSYDELREKSPDYLLKDLGDTEKIISIIIREG